MSQSKRISPFETIRHTDDNGNDYWDARELMPLLGYEHWQDFDGAIDRAIEDCTKSGRSVDENFRRSPKVSGKRGPAQKNYRLTRYACRLVVMAARPSTNPSHADAIAAHARTYFSDQVEAAETMDAQLVAIEELIRQAMLRVQTRDRLSASYDQLEAVASAMGMRTHAQFARLHNEGDLGMFHMSKYELAERHQVQPQHGKKRVNMNDHFSTTIMGGVILRNAFAAADIGEMEAPTNPEMWGASRDAGAEIREMMLKHGIVPEDQLPEPHICEARRIAEGQIPLLSPDDAADESAD